MTRELLSENPNTTTGKLMSSVNRAARYDMLAIGLHWLTLPLVIVIYLSIEVAGLTSPGSQLGGVLEDWHGYLGFVLLPIALIRLLNSRRKPVPPITPAPAKWQLTLARWMRKYLYILLIGMPLSGWIFLSADGAMINAWAFPLPAIAPENQGLAGLAERVHTLLGYSGYLFITVHALAALIQHYLIRNDTLSRMLPGAAGRR